MSKITIGSTSQQPPPPDYITWRPHAILRRLDVLLSSMPLVLQQIIAEYVRPTHISGLLPNVTDKSSGYEDRVWYSIVLPAPVRRLQVGLVWCDQGWGNQKGLWWPRLLRPVVVEDDVDKPIIVVDDRSVMQVLAPHKEERQCFDLQCTSYRTLAITCSNDIVTDTHCTMHERSYILDQTSTGDILQFCYHVGGGGGHELFIQQCMYRLDL